jgi:hypothetical protein
MDFGWTRRLLYGKVWRQMKLRLGFLFSAVSRRSAGKQAPNNHKTSSLPGEPKKVHATRIIRTYGPGKPGNLEALLSATIVH